MKAVAYYRVSTARQGQSGLGLAAQQSQCKAFVTGKGYELLSEYTEVESGKVNARPQLLAAIAAAKAQNAVLVIAKIDRLSRNAAFTMQLRDSGVNFVAADMPEANHLTVGIMALIAQDERERISARTKAALQAKKAQGFNLGKPENLTPAAMEKGRQAVAGQARVAYEKVSGYVAIMRSSGLTLRAIADKLNSEGFTTRHGKRYTAQQVQRVLEYTA
jgi:DNA invertase Pin-like site-specific DNA recombinase